MITICLNSTSELVSNIIYNKNYSGQADFKYFCNDHFIIDHNLMYKNPFVQFLYTKLINSHVIFNIFKIGDEYNFLENVAAAFINISS